MASWSECESIILQFKDHYSMTPSQHQLVYKYAMEVPKDGVAMELGICYGRTAALLGYCARENGFEAHGIDAFILVNDVSANSLRKQLAAVNLPYTIHEGWTAKVPWDRPLDLLIIDASHTDPWVSEDYKRWTPMLKVGGVGLFHDVEAVPDPTSPHYPTYLAAHQYTDDWQEEAYDAGLLVRRKI